MAFLGHAMGCGGRPRLLRHRGRHLLSDQRKLPPASSLSRTCLQRRSSGRCASSSSVPITMCARVLRARSTPSLSSARRTYRWQRSNPAKYKSVAWTAGYTDYAVSMLMNKDRPFTRLEDVRGRTVVSPDPDSITAAMLRAMLRDQKLGAADVKIVTTRYQDAVPF